MKRKIVFLFMLLLIATGAWAQTIDTAQLTITGTVDTIVRLTLSNTTNATDIPLTDPTTAPIIIADVTEIANTSYNITISTTNNFAFQSTVATGEVPYTITYAGQTINTTTEVKTSAPRGSTSEQVLLEHSGAGPEDDPATDYSDVITFTITANN